MTLQVINDFNLRMWARILVTAPAGPQVARALEQIHILADGVWEHEHMAGQSALYEVYHQLVSDAQALELAGQASPALTGALYASRVLEDIREGTGCDHPTGGIYDARDLPDSLQERWEEGCTDEACAEVLIFETMEEIIVPTHNLPLALETVQHLITGCLVEELEDVPPERYPRPETGRCVKLARWLLPWGERPSVQYLSCVEGELFTVDGRQAEVSREAYLSAIHQMERWVSLPELDGYLENCARQAEDGGRLKEAVKEWEDEIEALVPPEARWSSEFEEVNSQPEM